MTANTIDLMTRIEGHMKIETTLTGGRVSDARVSGEMFRCFENFLQNRHPFDAARITQIICGVCHEVHGVASILALEELYGVETPRNGRLLRDMILGMHLVTDHILHFYNLCLPDYADFTALLAYKGNDPHINSIKDWVVTTQPQFILTRNDGEYLSDPDVAIPMVANYIEALKVRSEGAAGIAILGAKAPFAHALMPGWITTPITLDRIAKYTQVLEEVSRFVKMKYLPDVLEVASRFKDYFSIGDSHDNYYGNESFSQLGSPLFKSGVVVNGELENFNFRNVTERIDHSYYDRNRQPSPHKYQAYSWIKAPRFHGQPLEVGPLARMVVNQEPSFFNSLTKLGLKYKKNYQFPSSAMARLVARAVESDIICGHLFQLVDAYQPGGANIRDVDLNRPVSGSGLGLSIAARGALIHHITAENGRISKYNMIVPSTWNFGPRDQQYTGIAEEALINTPVSEAGKDSIELGLVIRSFDPCTACAVH